MDFCAQTIKICFFACLKVWDLSLPTIHENLSISSMNNHARDTPTNKQRTVKQHDVPGGGKHTKKLGMSVLGFCPTVDTVRCLTDPSGSNSSNSVLKWFCRYNKLKMICRCDRRASADSCGRSVRRTFPDNFLLWRLQNGEKWYQHHVHQCLNNNARSYHAGL